MREPSMVEAMKLAKIIPKGRLEDLLAREAARVGVQKNTNLKERGISYYCEDT